MYAPGNASCDYYAAMVIFVCGIHACNSIPQLTTDNRYNPYIPSRE